MHIAVGAPSLNAASHLIRAARDGGECGMADVVDLETVHLNRDELIELVATLAATIERMSKPIEDVLKAIADDTETG